ncbi:DNA-binding protein HBsu [plant metagenome]|uniref:DNA-binding protein HBsu n=1 Tax=plant metagenome TaxID=1297885 RepID=A0A484TDM0_9ZZZZ
MSITKKELVAAVSDSTGIGRKDTEAVVDSLVATIQEQLQAGAEIAITGLGKFSPTQRGAREGRNPRTGETIQIAASIGVKFSAAKALKEAAAG